MTFRRVSVSTRVFSRRSSILVWLARRPILLAKVGDDVYAMDGICAHLGCALLTETDGPRATCPAHEAVWDVRTGELAAEPKIKPEMPCEEEALKAPLRTYPVREREGFLEVDV